MKIFQSKGIKFEEGFADVLMTYSKKTWGKSAAKFATTQEDRYQGTDLFVLETPIDVTLNFWHKRRTKRIGTLSFDGLKINFGLRFGNAFKTFPIPVLVIGVDCAVDMEDTNLWATLENLKTQAKNILDFGFDSYFAATEE